MNFTLTCRGVGAAVASRQVCPGLRARFSSWKLPTAWEVEAVNHVLVSLAAKGKRLATSSMYVCVYEFVCACVCVCVYLTWCAGGRPKIAE